MGLVGGWIVTAALLCLPFTILGWSSMRKSTQYLWRQIILPYRLVWVAVAVFAAIAGEKVWSGISLTP